ncbi:uncharacterized protein LOC34620662 [Cyclospora cayetanensis]|uniref:Uncharacterized protein LOC34620662 n=1 Tax=Cyclospora cayetanensis TaxID=88456 RepID=A0A6P6S1U3_9EIME|nr:uncharacterized protein LOC34620662 [Cyclospora cayetanensis]
MERDTPTRVFLLFTQVCILVLAGAQLALCLQPEWGNGFSVYDIASAEFFNLHPLLNVLAFGVAMTESLISFQGFGLRHGVAKTLHALLQLASLILGIAAFSIVVAYHNANSYPNFYRFAPPALKAAFLRYHKVGGLAVYCGAMAAVCTGLMQKQSFLRSRTPQAPLFGSANLLANATAVVSVLTALGVLGVLGADRTTSAGCEASRPGDPSCATPFPPPGTADTGFMGAENQPSAQLRRNKAPSNRPPRSLNQFMYSEYTPNTASMTGETHLFRTPSPFLGPVGVWGLDLPYCTASYYLPLYAWNAETDPCCMLWITLDECLLCWLTDSFLVDPDPPAALSNAPSNFLASEAQSLPAEFTKSFGGRGNTQELMDYMAKNASEETTGLYIPTATSCYYGFYAVCHPIELDFGKYVRPAHTFNSNCPHLCAKPESNTTNMQYRVRLPVALSNGAELPRHPTNIEWRTSVVVQPFDARSSKRCSQRHGNFNVLGTPSDFAASVHTQESRGDLESAH